MADYGASGGFTSNTISASATTVTTTLIAPGVNAANRVAWISGYSVNGTNLDVEVTKNDGTTVICRYGGSVQPPALNVQRFPLPGIICAKNDAAKVILNQNGAAGAMQLTVGYDNVAA